jgi:hypothetical protein
MNRTEVGRGLSPLLAPFPALIIGALVMRQHAVPSSQWGLNLVAGLLGAAICAGVLARSRTAMSRTAATISGCLAVGALAATFAMAGSMGVHRWIPIGPVTVHAGAVCLPLVIVALGASNAFGRELQWTPLFMANSVGTLLFLQPDAAQATGFAAAVAVLLIGNKERGPGAWGAAMVIGVLAAWTWVRPDPLQPVPYVEGIVGLAGQNGVAWVVAAIMALALLPLPFFIRPFDSQSTVARALGFYLCVCILAPIFRPFPVPLVGFGLSPIVGYFVALASLPSIDRQ